MSDSGSLHAAAAHDRSARDAVVRPLARAAQRPCVRPGCPSPARASLSFRYESREAWLERLSDEPRPESYDLCGSHAARTRPPHGWQLRDRRPREEQVDGEPPPTPEHLGGEETVAVLAAALRSVPPEAPSEGAGTERLEDTASPVIEPLRPEPAGSPAESDAVASPAESDAVASFGESDEVVSPDESAEVASPAEPAEVASPPEPRPVPAARQRHPERERDRPPGGPARHW